MYIRSASAPSTVLWAFHTIQQSSYKDYNDTVTKKRYKALYKTRQS